MEYLLSACRAVSIYEVASRNGYGVFTCCRDSVAQTNKCRNRQFVMLIFTSIVKVKVITCESLQQTSTLTYKGNGRSVGLINHNMAICINKAELIEALHLAVGNCQIEYKSCRSGFLNSKFEFLSGARIA